MFAFALPAAPKLLGEHRHCIKHGRDQLRGRLIAGCRYQLTVKVQLGEPTGLVAANRRSGEALDRGLESRQRAAVTPRGGQPGCLDLDHGSALDELREKGASLRSTHEGVQNLAVEHVPVANRRNGRSSDPVAHDSDAALL